MFASNRSDIIGLKGYFLIEVIIQVFDAIDKAWAALDYETVKSYIADDAEMRFADGKFAVGGEEFVSMIQQEVEEWGEAEYVWTTDYKFSLATNKQDEDAITAGCNQEMSDSNKIGRAHV